VIHVEVACVVIRLVEGGREGDGSSSPSHNGGS